MRSREAWSPEESRGLRKMRLKGKCGIKDRIRIKEGQRSKEVVSEQRRVAEMTEQVILTK